MPPTVTKLDGAFFTFPSIEEVVLPYTLKEITGASFYGCTNLQKITIPSSVTKIGDYSFAYCTNLQEVDIAGDLSSIGMNVFWDTQWFKSLDEGAIYLGKVFYKYIGEIPTSYTIKDGTKGIASGAFRGIYKTSWGYSYNNSYNSNLNTIIFPDSLEEIGEEAFYSCKNLANVQLPSSIKIIDHNAFNGCNNIKSIEFPTGMKEIGNCAFQGSGLQTITFNGNIDKIGKDAFNSTSWFNNQSSGTVYIGNVLYKYKNTGSSNVVVDVKAGTISIGEGAFSYNSEISEVNLPDSLITIGANAFAYCTNLNKVTMGNSIQEIGAEAFSGDENLELNELPSSLKIIRQYAFSNCKKVFTDGLTIKDGVTYIGNSAFTYTNIEKVTIPSSVKTIAQCAFRGCEKLKEVKIAEGLQILTDCAFENCYALEDVELPGSISFYGIDIFARDKKILQIKVNKRRQNTVLEKTLENACPKGTLILYLGEGEQKYNITTDNNDVTVLSSAYQNQRVYINTKSDAQIVKSFDLDGEHMVGNYFTMPAKNVVISNIEFDEQIVIEKTFENEVILADFEEAFSENTAIKITLDDVSTQSNVWTSIYLFDSNGTFIKSFSNSELEDKPIYLNDKGIKVKLFNWNNTVSSYHFRLIINKTDELEYQATETPHPYKSGCYYALTTMVEGAENIFYKFSEECAIRNGDNLSMHQFYNPNANTYNDRSLAYLYNSTDIQNYERIATDTNNASFVLDSKADSLGEAYGIKYSVESYVTPENVLESSHNYENNLDKYYTKTIENAEVLRLTFDEKTRFENSVNYDRLTIYYTKNGTEYTFGTYTGEQLANKQLIIPANNVKFLFHTDGSVTFYGFRCTVEGLENVTYETVGDIITVQSPHQYANSRTYNYSASLSGDIDGMIITFDQLTELESGCDKLYIQDANGTTLETKTGSFGGAQITLYGMNQVKFKLTTDGSVTKWGFRCTVQGFKISEQ